MRMVTPELASRAELESLNHTVTLNREQRGPHGKWPTVQRLRRYHRRITGERCSLGLVAQLGGYFWRTTVWGKLSNTPSV